MINGVNLYRLEHPISSVNMFRVSEAINQKFDFCRHPLMVVDIELL